MIPAGQHHLSVTAGTLHAAATSDLGDGCSAVLTAGQPNGPDHPLTMAALTERPIPRIPNGQAFLRLLLATGATDVVLLAVVALSLGATGCQGSRPAATPALRLTPSSVAAAPPQPPSPTSTASKAPLLLTKYVDAPVVALATVDVARLPALLSADEIGRVDGSDPIDGTAGTTILVGHVTYGDKPAVFATLGTASPGDDVIVRHGGSDDHYTVDSVASYRKGDLPPALWSPQPLRTLILITCGGPIDAATGLHVLNVVVVAHLSSSTLAPA